MLPQHSSGISTTVFRQLDELAQDHALFFLPAALIPSCCFGHHRLTLLHREPHPHLQLAAASGGKSRFISSTFLFEATIPIWSTFLMRQFDHLTFYWQ